jgi:ATP-dependent RNA helicase DDX3X
LIECDQAIPEFLQQYRPEGDVLEFDDDSDKEFFDNQSNAGAEAEADHESSNADAESAAAQAEAEESDKVVADDAEDDKPAVPRPTITSEEEEEASTWWGPTTIVTERKKPREEAKPKDTKAGLAGSHWAPKPKPAPKDDDAFWQ